MADATIFGYDINIIGIYANIGVAIGTLALAWYTFKSVQTSKKTLEFLRTQVDIARKDFENKQTELEKPQIIDQLQYILNPLRNSIGIEMRQINDKLIFWESFKSKESSLYLPEKSNHEFYDDPNISTQLGSIIYSIDSRHQDFSEICNERHKIIIQIYDLFRELFDELNSQGIPKKMDESIKKFPGYICHPAGFNAFNEQEWNEAIVVDNFDPDDDPPYTSEYIDLHHYTVIAFNIEIANMLTQRVISKKSSEELIIQDYHGTAELKNSFVLIESNGYSGKFQTLINELKTINTRLLIKIDEIRIYYQKNYHLTDEELWKIKLSKFSMN